MPELPEVETTRRALEPAMQGAWFTDVIVRRPNLRTPFPAGFATRLAGARVLALTRRAKYLLAHLSSDETLVMHLGMSGSFRVDAAGEPPDLDPHDHVSFHLSSGAIVTFNDPRRFGSMDLVPSASLASHPSVGALGPEPLSAAFDGATLARACRGRRTSIKAALLDQRVVAGLGNIYASEALHRAGLSPKRRASTIATASGLPRPAAHRLAAAIKQVLIDAISRATSARAYRTPRFRVYEREDERCRRPRCGGLIRRVSQAGRSTFYCPICQR